MLRLTKVGAGGSGCRPITPGTVALSYYLGGSDPIRTAIVGVEEAVLSQELRAKRSLYRLLSLVKQSHEP